MVPGGDRNIPRDSKREKSKHAWSMDIDLIVHSTLLLRGKGNENTKFSYLQNHETTIQASSYQQTSLQARSQQHHTHL
jgi:hypothetical protein